MWLCQFAEGFTRSYWQPLRIHFYFLLPRFAILTYRAVNSFFAHPLILADMLTSELFILPKYHTNRQQYNCQQHKPYCPEYFHQLLISFYSLFIHFLAPHSFQPANIQHQVVPLNGKTATGKEHICDCKSTTLFSNTQIFLYIFVKNE